MSIGRIVGGKYCLLHEIGGGAMGTVWAAEHLLLRSHVALKLIKPSFAGSSEAMRRFEQEARAAAALNSRHVVQVRDYGVDAGNPYLVMELLDGESLAARLDRGRLAASEVGMVVDHVAKALSKVHAAGFVHRDLKPHNLYLTSDDAGLLVKVLDFGVTKTLADSATSLTRTGLLVGTLHYMSPEQAEAQPIDSRSDLWSLGVIAFECLTGRVPFDETTIEGLLDAICSDPIVVPSQIARVPAGFDAWFARAVQRDRRHRFQSARELAEELLPLLASDESSWVGEWSEEADSGRSEAETVHLHTFPSGGPDRRGDVRSPSQIPAGIDRRRDLRHTALIYNWSRTGALLLTRHPCKLEQELMLTLHLDSAEHGETLAGRVVRVSPRNDPIWTLEVGVRFVEPLTDALLQRLSR